MGASPGCDWPPEPPPWVSLQFQNLQLEREMRLASNYALARQNLALQPRLETGKASLAIKYQELRELREACRDKQQRLGEWESGPHPHLGKPPLEALPAGRCPVTQALCAPARWMRVMGALQPGSACFHDS